MQYDIKALQLKDPENTYFGAALISSPPECFTMYFEACGDILLAKPSLFCRKIIADDLCINCEL